MADNDIIPKADKHGNTMLVDWDSGSVRDTYCSYVHADGRDGAHAAASRRFAVE